MRLYLTKREKEIDKFLKACINFYGVLKHRDFLNIINKYVEPKVKKQEILGLWGKLMSAGEEQIFKRGYIVYTNLIVADVVTDELIEDIDKEWLKNIPNISKKTPIIAIRCFFIERN